MIFGNGKRFGYNSQISTRFFKKQEREFDT